jgi:hypothetical protein
MVERTGRHGRRSKQILDHLDELINVMEIERGSTSLQMSGISLWKGAAVRQTM